jgi:secreted trypsin-like serine protease
MQLRVLTSLAVGACLIPAACDRPVTGPVPADRPSRITNGVLDGDRHPAVVLIIMDVDKRPAYRCSGTLIAPKVVLTAGHCTGEPGEFTGMRIFTESDVDNGDNDFPYAGPNTVEAARWHTPEAYTSAAFFRNDVGVIELTKAVKLPADAYGRLPTVDQLDALKPSQSTRFTAVGYGLQRINPAQVTAERVRMLAEPHLLQINSGFTGSFSLLLSNNASSGGTCFGDSGGPNYLGSSNVIAGVTSFGLNGACGGTGGVFRLDRKDVLAFVAQYLTK